MRSSLGAVAIALMALALVIIVLSSVSISASSPPSGGGVMISASPRVYRIVDNEFGVVCYVANSGILCLDISR